MSQGKPDGKESPKVKMDHAYRLLRDPAVNTIGRPPENPENPKAALRCVEYGTTQNDLPRDCGLNGVKHKNRKRPWFSVSLRGYSAKPRIKLKVKQP